MIVQVVKETTNCMDCPNFRRIHKRKNNVSEIYKCEASGTFIGGSDGEESILYLRNNVSPLCPFKENDVNQ